MPWIIVGGVMAFSTLFFVALYIAAPNGYERADGFHYGKEEDEDHVV